MIRAATIHQSQSNVFSLPPVFFGPHLRYAHMESCIGLAAPDL